jgi:hypothetical protein
MIRLPAIRRRPALALLGVAVFLGLWQGTTFLFAMRAAGDDTPWPEPYLWELTGYLAAYTMLLLPIAAVLDAPRPFWSPRALVVHGVAFAGYTAGKNTLMIGARYALYPLLGWGGYDYGFSVEHLAMEVMKDGFGYVLIATTFTLYRAWRERQALALREAALAAELKEARLQALGRQLDPHFFFNALNTVSSVMYEDLERTDRLLADLGQVLRAGLDRDRPTWPLAEERAHTDRFFGLLHARFGERIRLCWEVEPGLEQAAIPRFSFQLLLENAVKHNQDRPGPLEVRLRARRAGDRLVLEAEDDGRGFGAPSRAAGAGLGLRHLEQTLALLHGERARLERGAGPEGGARVTLTLPEAA